MQKSNLSIKINFCIKKISTGTRIRTQIKGFGDPYATVAPCPCIKKNSKQKAKRNPFDFFNWFAKISNLFYFAQKFSRKVGRCRNAPFFIFMTNLNRMAL